MTEEEEIKLAMRKHQRDAQSLRRLLRVAITAVVSIAVLAHLLA